MSPLTLTLRDHTAGGLDLGSLTPETLASVPAKSRARLRVPCGRRQVALGDLFELSGDDPTSLRLFGLHDGCHRVGRGMSSGAIEVRGSVGMECGREMRGGTLEVSGNAGPGAALGMRGGLLRIRGNAGDSVGGPLAGATAGMNGGTVIIGGNVGARAGERMRRGLLVIAGDSGPSVGDRMIAGTIVVFGHCGPQPGLGMRRGTLMLAAPPDAGLDGAFNDCGTFELGMVALLARDVRAVFPQVGRRLGSFASCRRWCGDIAFGGKGEILVAAPVAAAGPATRPRRTQSSSTSRPHRR